MTNDSNVIPFPTNRREYHGMNALLVEILEDIAGRHEDEETDRDAPEWQARAEAWAATQNDPQSALSALGVAGVILAASVLLDTGGEDGLREYIAWARSVWPGVSE